MSRFLITFVCLCLLVIIVRQSKQECAQIGFRDFAEYKKANCVKGDEIIEQAIFEQINDGKIL